ncbi:hypothetical protein [Candidatus Thalassarchaeum betae]|jgi:hypothetical protein|uniref:hypothetical protein n=1 Tax=Candidatus Thalassarchaeum betae TaxID=2599289 RepID=UPI0030C772F6|nr:hypothetical protein [Candidatus Thalassoarchaea betae]
MWFWIALFIALGVITLYYSRHQPFPEISGRFAAVLIIIGIVLWISTTAPRPTTESVPAIVAAFIGGVAVVIGVIHMAVLRDDVVVAPFGGILLCMGAISLMGDMWADMGQTEQIGSFTVASILVLLEIYLVFRGLVVGVQAISWSKSGLRQVRRGLIHGPNGAISHFERSWDMENPWINAMSHAALALIHRHAGNQEEEREHILELEKAGGWESVDEAWIGAMEKALGQTKPTSLRDD